MQMFDFNADKYEDRETKSLSVSNTVWKEFKIICLREGKVLSRELERYMLYRISEHRKNKGDVNGEKST